jgi:integrase
MNPSLQPSPNYLAEKLASDGTIQTVDALRSSQSRNESMAKRRWQAPTPKRRGAWWEIQVRRDDFIGGKNVRTKTRVRIAPATMGEREARKVAAEYLRPTNHSLESLGSATNFQSFVVDTFNTVTMPLFASSTRSRYRGIVNNYLLPTFGGLALRELTPLTLQEYFTQMSTSKLSHESRDKIRDVLASILSAAVKYGMLASNPAENVRIPAERRGRTRAKPFLYPNQFDEFLTRVPEPYASMLYVAIYTGLRVSELASLRWNDVGEKTLTIDERFCRGDWGAPKSDASNATIAVNRSVIERIHRLKLLTVEVRAGRAKRKYHVVKSDGPDDLVFQSVRDGKPLRDNNVLRRFIKPAAPQMGLGWVNWRSLRTSHATWLKMAGADVKDAQAQMRHAHASTTQDIYQQFVPESQRRAVDLLSGLSQRIN